MPALKAFANLLYPPVCVLCRKQEAASGDRGTRARFSAENRLEMREQSVEAGAGPMLCESCRQTMVRCQAPVCQQCGLSVAAAYDALVKCRECSSRPRLFTSARAPWQYTGPVQQAIHQFKYSQRWRLGHWLALEMVRLGQETLPLVRIDLVSPIPSHWLKRRLRGFDPAAMLARLVAEKINKPCLPQALKRARWTRSQTRLSWPKRLRNVKEAFKANKSLVSGRAILLIDDVLTSGATAESCSSALLGAGAREVFVLTAARTPLN